MGRRKQEEPSNPSGTKKVNGTVALIKALLMNAHNDTPREIVEWCKTSLCKSLCYWFDIDINTYRRKMLSMALKKDMPEAAPAFPVITTQPEIKKPIIKEPEIAIALPDIEFGPLFQCNFSKYKEKKAL